MTQLEKITLRLESKQRNRDCCNLFYKVTEMFRNRLKQHLIKSTSARSVTIAVKFCDELHVVDIFI